MTIYHFLTLNARHDGRINGLQRLIRTLERRPCFFACCANARAPQLARGTGAPATCPIGALCGNRSRSRQSHQRGNVATAIQFHHRIDDGIGA
ncbi:hypothetical protein [Paraburkholderia sp. J63]|uniref:hypothetical protein n=1 Tax=Paraburkholderia sp. J63 TaxID=2805434 RepID=UPI002ABD99EC|nr:hypothetical protein [Paraburkholderia sp. J63]